MNFLKVFFHKTKNIEDFPNPISVQKAADCFCNETVFQSNLWLDSSGSRCTPLCWHNSALESCDRRLSNAPLHAIARAREPFQWHMNVLFAHFNVARCSRGKDSSALSTACCGALESFTLRLSDAQLRTIIRADGPLREHCKWGCINWSHAMLTQWGSRARVMTSSVVRRRACEHSFPTHRCLPSYVLGNHHFESFAWGQLVQLSLAVISKRPMSTHDGKQCCVGKPESEAFQWTTVRKQRVASCVRSAQLTDGLAWKVGAEKWFIEDNFQN